MKRYSLALLVASVVSGLSASSRVAGKTYYASRTETHHMEREWLMNPLQINAGTPGVTMQVYGFSASSDNDKGLGTYFGAASERDNSDAIGTVEIVRDDEGIARFSVPAFTAKKSNALYGRHIDHLISADITPSATPDYRPVAGIMTLRPKEHRQGYMFALRADLRGGWSFAAALPLLRVKHNWHATEAGVTRGYDSATATPFSYFDGTYKKSARAYDTQLPLLKGKLFSGDRETKLGVGDLQLRGEYVLCKDKELHLAISAETIIPLAAKDTGEFLFDAVNGNNGHVGAGVGVQARWVAWQHESKPFKLMMSGALRAGYLFQGQEKRILGLYDVVNDRVAPWLHYALAGEYPKSADTEPLVNVLWRDVNVTPGAHWQSLFGATLSWRRVNVSVGYQCFMRQKEAVELAQAWPNDRFGLATYDWQTNDPKDDFAATAFSSVFEMTDTSEGAVETPSGSGRYYREREALGPIQQPGKFDTAIPTKTYTKASVSGDNAKKPVVLYQYSTDACSTPGFITHTVMSGLTFDFSFRKMNGCVSFGVSYEYTPNPTTGLQGVCWFGGISLSL